MQHDERGLVPEKHVDLPLQHDEVVPLAEILPLHHDLPKHDGADSRLVEADDHAVGPLLDPEYLCRSDQLLQLGGAEILEVVVVVPEGFEESGLGQQFQDEVGILMVLLDAGSC